MHCLLHLFFWLKSFCPLPLWVLQRCGSRWWIDLRIWLMLKTLEVRIHNDFNYWHGQYRAEHCHAATRHLYSEVHVIWIADWRIINLMQWRTCVTILNLHSPMTFNRFHGFATQKKKTNKKKPDRIFLLFCVSLEERPSLHCCYYVMYLVGFALPPAKCFLRY